ncbi:MAG: LysR family transcriptional regulator [Rhodospirillaceae bacterium]|nr:LysR family transcriptional regulator [Rhodospirillaceae bacterium]
MTDLAGIAVFTEVARLGGFTAAAQSLGLSKSTVSKQIARLEDRLDVKLLHRTTRRLSLTEVGQAYFERCRRIIEEAEEAEQAVTHLHAEPRGTLRVNVPMSFGILHVAEVLPAFMAQYPDLSVDLELNDRRVDLVDEGFDMAIRIGKLSDSTLVARRLAPCRIAVVASPDYWTKHGKPAHPEDLKHHRSLIYTLRSRPTEMQFRGPDGLISVNGTGRLRANNGNLLLTAAKAGTGVYICPTFFCGPGLKDGSLEEALIDYPPPETTVYAVWPQSRHLSAKVRAFVDFLVDAFGPEPYWDRGLTLPPPT